MKNIFVVLFLFLGISCCGITLQDAVKLGLEKNPEIKSLENAKLSALSSLENAKHPLASDIGLAASYQNTKQRDTKSFSLVYDLKYSFLDGSVVDLSTSPMATGSSATSLMLNFTKPFLKGSGKLSDRYLTITSADLFSQKTELSNWISVQNLIYSITANYVNTVLASQQIKIQEDTLESTKRSASDAQKRADEKLIAGIEVQRAMIRVSQQEDRLSKSYQNYYQYLDTLRLSIGQEVETIKEVDLNSIPDAENIVLPTEEDAVKMALESRRQLEIYDIETTDLELEYKKANDNLKNALNAFATVNNNGANDFIVNGDLWNNRDIVVGMEYKIPLDQKILKNNKANTKRSLDYKIETKAYEKEKIVAEVHSAFLSIEQSKQSIGILTQNIKTAEENVYVATRMVDEGLSSNREVLDAEDSLLTARSDMVSAKVDLYLAILNLQKAMGQDILGMVVM